MDKPMPVCPNKHRHHFVPQGHLRGFTISGQKSMLWEYDKHRGSVSKMPKSVRSVCYRANHNLLIGNDDKPDYNALEDSISRNVETPALKIIKQLYPTPGRCKISDADRECLSLYFSFLLTRNPGIRDGVEEIQRRIIDCFVQANLRKIPQPVELPENVGIQVVVHHQASVKAMLDMASAGMKSLLRKKWVFFLPASGTAFVISDCPAVVGYDGSPFAPVGPFHHLSEIIVPIRKDLGLACIPESPHPDKTIDVIALTRKDVTRFNERITGAAIRYVYACENSPELLRMIKESKGMSQKIDVR